MFVTKSRFVGLASLLVLVASQMLCSSVLGAVIASGDVDPSDPATWTKYTSVNIGNTGVGSLSISGGSSLIDYSASIGTAAGAAGTVTVDGDESVWTNNDELIIGDEGSGDLRISNGANVNSSLDSYNDCYIGYGSDSVGTVTVEGDGSLWSNENVLYIGYWGEGTLDIRTGGELDNNYSASLGYKSGSSGIVNVDGTGSKWTNWNIVVGKEGDGTLNITNGGVVESSGGNIADDEFSIGLATVSGSGSRWNSSQDIWVGNYRSDGTLKVLNGGVVTSDGIRIGVSYGSTGLVTVDGAGSQWISSGDIVVTDSASNDSTLNVFNGAEVSGKATYVGNGVSSMAYLVVDGNNSKYTSKNTLNVGYSSGGTMTVRNHAQVVSDKNGYIGYGAGYTGGTVNVNGSGSLWTNTESLYVGYNGRGKLFITGGGKVDSAISSGSGCYVGEYSSISCEVSVDGNNSRWMCGHDLYLGNATLDISNAGAVEVNGDVKLHESAEINFNGGTLTAIGSLRAGSSQLTGTGSIYAAGIVCDTQLVFDSPGDLEQTIVYDSEAGQDIEINLTIDGQGIMGAGYSGNGEMEISNGMLVPADDAFIGYVSGSSGEVTVTDGGSVWLIGDDLVVGLDGAGILTIDNGGLVSVAGDLTIDNDGDGNGFINMTDGGRLAITGQVGESLAIFLDLIDGTDDIRIWDSSVSQWIDINSATYGKDYLLIDHTDGGLAGMASLLAEPLRGDINGDNIVNLDDFIILKQNYGQTVPGWLGGDLNGDGRINLDDFIILKQNFGVGY